MSTNREKLPQKKLNWMLKVPVLSGMVKRKLACKKNRPVAGAGRAATERG